MRKETMMEKYVNNIKDFKEFEEKVKNNPNGIIFDSNGKQISLDEAIEIATKRKEEMEKEKIELIKVIENLDKNKIKENKMGKKTIDKSLITISLDIEIVEYIKNIAKEEERKISNVANMMLKKYIKDLKGVNDVVGLNGFV